MPLIVESILVLLLFYILGIGLGWLLWARKL